MANELSRREVLIGSTAAAIGLAAGPALAAQQPKPATDKTLRIGVIGCGGKGWSGMQDAANFGLITAVCDVDQNDLQKAMQEHRRASAFRDYRVMLDAMKGRLDAVVISTPDHHHALASALAMKAGMHVYCEKPLTRTISESRELERIARRTRVATQMGNQSTASTPMRKVAALLARKEWGEVKEIHLWTDRAGGWWPQGVSRPAAKAAPNSVDFDLWLGPSPERPYADGYHHFAWRGWWDFGTGSLGDMGCHIFNLSHMAFDLRDPVAVQAKTSGHNRDSFPTWSIVTYEYPARRGRPAFELHWYDGGKRPDSALAPGMEFGGNGVIVVCERATVFGANEGNYDIKLVGGQPMPEVSVTESPGHMAEFARAALGGPAAVSNFPTYACGLNEAVLLGNLAIWADGPRLEWDGRSMSVKGTDEFDALIRPTYRAGWGL